MAHAIGIDVGTTNLKVVLANGQEAMVAAAILGVFGYAAYALSKSPPRAG